MPVGTSDEAERIIHEARSDADVAITLRCLGRIAGWNRAGYWYRGSAASFAAPVRVRPQQAIAGGEVADLRAQIALLALEAARTALLGYQFDEKAPDQCGERSAPLCSLGPGSPIGLVIN